MNRETWKKKSANPEGRRFQRNQSENKIGLVGNGTRFHSDKSPPATFGQTHRDVSGLMMKPFCASVDIQKRCSRFDTYAIEKSHFALS